MNKHDFKVEEVYENGQFMGELYKCTKCGHEHLCRERISTICVHLEAFYTGCNG